MNLLNGIYERLQGFPALPSLFLPHHNKCSYCTCVFYTDLLSFCHKRFDDYRTYEWGREEGREEGEGGRVNKKRHIS